jgi:anti-sigma-K factor RskA
MTHPKPTLRLITNPQYTATVSRYDGRHAHHCTDFARVNRQHSKPSRADLWATRAAWTLIVLSIIATVAIALSSGLAIAGDAIAHPHVEGFE